MFFTGTKSITKLRPYFYFLSILGVEVKSGESLKVDPGDDKIIHLSNVYLYSLTNELGVINLIWN